MKIFYLLLAVVLLNACSKEETLTPGPVAPLYQLPQGNATYDDSIVSLNKKFGTYVLYKFSQVDYSYNYTAKLPDSAFNGNPAYVGAALQFFTTEILNNYPDSFLRKTLPVKILLASYIGSGNTRSATGFAITRSMLCIGWADSTMSSKTPTELKAIKGYLHRSYMERACQALAIGVPPGFVSLSPTDYSRINLLNHYTEGVIEPVNEKLTLFTDFLGYVQYITSHTYAQAVVDILNPKQDTKGMTKKKYTAVIDYFNDFGVDLQAIGEKN